MANPLDQIRAPDVYEPDFLTRPQLNTDGTVVYLTTTVVSTTSGTKTVVVNTPSDGEGIQESRDHPVMAGDTAVISGTSGGAGDGTYTVASVVNDTTFTVSQSIGTSTGGSVNFEWPVGAQGIGFSLPNQAVSPTNNVQATLQEVANVELLNVDPENAAGVTYTPTYTSGKVTREAWAYTVSTLLIKSIDYTYTGSKVTTEVRKVYAANGSTVIAEVTYTYTYSGSSVTSVAQVRNV